MVAILPLAAILPNQAFARGGWFVYGNFVFPPATAALLSSKVNDGLGELQNGAVVELNPSLPVSIRKPNKSNNGAGYVETEFAPPLSLTKTSAVFDLPKNGTASPNATVGALVINTIAVNNPGNLTPDRNSIEVSDAIPPGFVIHVADFGALASGPVQFIDGSPTSRLAYTFSTLASVTDDIEFSSDGGSTWTYIPTPNSHGDDPQVTHIRVKPQGAMAPATSFQINVRYRVN